MNKLLDTISENFVLIFAILCFTTYEIVQFLGRSRSRLEKYNELKVLNELREKGVISQEEFDEKKEELLTD